MYKISFTYLNDYSDLLKIGTLFPVFKKKGDIKNSRNYKGITITPTYSKIIEKIIKEREKYMILHFDISFVIIK
jgi:hypothetical protein